MQATLDSAPDGRRWTLRKMMNTYNAPLLTRRIARFICVALSTLAVLLSLFGIAVVLRAPQLMLFEGKAGLRGFTVIWIVTVGLLFITKALGEPKAPMEIDK